ncbi:MAG: hypothetical protein MR270_07560 [Erysipelotrichaceae bacterium]|nr:hypothetical protein [Erysipelotrichaceae bacterium]
MEENKVMKSSDGKDFTDDELIEDVKSDDDAPVSVVYRCKKCGQILSSGAKDCWKCSSKDIEEVVEEETKELKKVMLQARIDKLENDIKSIKKNNDFLYVLFAIMVVLVIVILISK